MSDAANTVLAPLPARDPLPPLSPAQQRTLESVQQGLQLNALVGLWGHQGHGRTTILRHLQRECGGVLLNLGDWLRSLAASHPLALEETFERCVRELLDQQELVLIDDVHLLENVVNGCGGSYPRCNLFEIACKILADRAIASSRRLVFAGSAPLTFRQRAYGFAIEGFGPDDYEHIVRAGLAKESADQLDFAKIHRYACGLDCWDLSLAARWMGQQPQLDTEGFIDYLRSQGLWSNVDLREVRNVCLKDLVGVDDVIEQLETHVVLPLENDELAVRFGLRPKRGVLLLGPPGTGKTTVGRALAHRLRGKFFRIDGTFIAGTEYFYHRVERVFHEATENAPAVIFIDDCDAIFEHGREQGLYRYLLTLLDGLESESAGRVCVIMTAMKLEDLPPALVRSGRIELWLETRRPDDKARRVLLEQLVAGLPADLGPVDVDELVTASAGFTGADLRPIVQDGKNLLAYDLANGRAVQPLMHYFRVAISAILSNHRRAAACLNGS